MDPVTHGLLGAIAGVSVWRVQRRRNQASASAQVRAGMQNPALSKRQALGIGTLAGMFPDIDILTYLINPLYYNAYWHGTYTHSLLLAPLWAGLLTLVFTWIGRHLSARSLSQPVIFLICLLGIGTHVLGDLITAWDIGLLMPLFDTRVSLGLLFIIDPLFTLLLALLLIALVRPWSPGIVLLCLCLPLGWVAAAGAYKYNALALAHGSLNEVVDTPQQAQVKAWPQPFSLSHWKLVYHTDDGVWGAHVRLIDRAPLRWPANWLNRSASSYTAISAGSNNVPWRFYSRHPTPSSEQAWNRPEFEAVRDFMTYPVFLRQDSLGCVWFTDWLFAIPTQAPPFQYAACQSAEGDWQVHRGQVTRPWG